MLRNTSFRALWLNTITFYLVANALRFVYGWVALDGLEANEFWQGFIVFMLGVPSVLLVLPSGVWADRLNPRHLLYATQVAMLVAMAGTALLIGDGAGSLAILVVSALIAGAATAIGGPVRSSLIPALIKGERLYSAIALNAIAITLSLVLGAVTARLFGDWFGFDGAFWYLAALLIAGMVMLWPMQVPKRDALDSRTTMRQAMGEGLSFVWNNRGIRMLFVLLCVAGFIMTPIMFVTLQAHIKEELGRTAADAAPMLALLGVGIATSSVVIMRRGNMKNKSVLFMRAMLGGTSSLFLMGRATAYWQILVLALILGLCGGFFINMNQGLIQTNTPPEVMGRVMGLYALAQAGLTPFGALILGAAATKIGTGNTVSIGAAVGFSIVLLTYLKSESIRSIN